MSADAREYEDDLTRIEKLVGKIDGNARYEIIDALDEDRDGVFALASRLGGNEKLDRPSAVLIAAIRKGEHRGAAEQGELRRTPREAFRGFFLEYQEWLLDVCDVDENRAIEWALDYAVGSMSARSPRINGQLVRISAYERDQTAQSMENEMRESLNRARPVTTGEERERMTSEWTIIGLCLHDERVSAMHRCLMDQCAIPREPSHAEARDARVALAAEIVALGVKPRRLATVEGAEGFVTVGEALDQTRA